MFTGIIAGTGKVKKLECRSNDVRLWVQSPFSLKDTKIGDSIAVNGCCLTVTKKQGKTFSADLSPETLDRTTLGELHRGDPVNLETPLRMGDALGGHLVQGHVDGVGTLVKKEKVAAKPEPYHLLKVKVPKPLQPYMIEKGSVAVDGISLTINRVQRGQIELCIIPHTSRKTALTGKKRGARLNLEADMMLKYLKKLASPNLRTWKKRN